MSRERSFLGQDRSLSVPAAARSAISCLVELSAKGSNAEHFLFQPVHVCCLPLLLSPNPDHCCVSSWFYHWEQPATRRDSVLGVESACSCSQISAFCAVGASCAHTASLFPSPVPVWRGAERKLGNPGVEALLWKLDILRVGPFIALICVTEQSGLYSVLWTCWGRPKFVIARTNLLL